MRGFHLLKRLSIVHSANRGSRPLSCLAKTTSVRIRFCPDSASPRGRRRRGRGSWRAGGRGARAPRSSACTGTLHCISFREPTRKSFRGLGSGIRSILATHKEPSVSSGQLSTTPSIESSSSRLYESQPRAQTALSNSLFEKSIKERRRCGARGGDVELAADLARKLDFLAAQRVCELLLESRAVLRQLVADERELRADDLCELWLLNSRASRPAPEKDCEKTRRVAICIL